MASAQAPIPRAPPPAPFAFALCTLQKPSLMMYTLSGSSPSR